MLPLSPAVIRKYFNEFAANDKKTPPSNDSCDAQTNGIKLKDGVYIATTSAAALYDNPDAPCYTMLCWDMCFINNDPMPHILHPVVTNLLQEFDAGMESRTTPIQEGEDDEDIAMLDMHEPASSPSYKSTPTRFSRSSRIQTTPLHGFGDISLIRSQNEVILDALES